MATKQIKLSAGKLAWVSRERKKVVEEAGATKECPKCKRRRNFEFFGVRTFKDPKSGMPVRFAPQSYCVDCRSVKKPKAEAKKTTGAKAKATKKAANPPKKVKVVKKTRERGPAGLAAILPGGSAVEEKPLTPAQALAHLVKTETAAKTAPAAASEAPIPTMPANEPVIPAAAPAPVATTAPAATEPAPPAAPVVTREVITSATTKTGKKRKLGIVDVTSTS